MGLFFFFFFNDTATTEIYTLSLHDALPIYGLPQPNGGHGPDLPHVLHHDRRADLAVAAWLQLQDRKSTRLNSSHSQISYAVFCLKKKNECYIRHSKSHHPVDNSCVVYLYLQ